jgi:2-polyprenyl-3-methyl-5-hydroxy-6-metoxy-1,4-benzoquinol methylase
MTPAHDFDSHWEAVYQSKDPRDVSWYQASPAMSLSLITQHSSHHQDIVDVGAGASLLIDSLLAAGYRQPCALDVAEPALLVSRQRLGGRADDVDWQVADVLNWRPQRRFDVWHDRAVFHFLTDPSERACYLDTLLEATHQRAVVIVGTFGPEGPQYCSGLPVARYSALELAGQFCGAFTLIDQHEESHLTPAGAVQAFTWVVLRRERS